MVFIFRDGTTIASQIDGTTDTITISGENGTGTALLKGLTNPVDDSDATTKQYVDNASGGIGGQDTQLIYNNAGLYNGISTVTTDGTNLSLSDNTILSLGDTNIEYDGTDLTIDNTNNSGSIIAVTDNTFEVQNDSAGIPVSISANGGLNHDMLILRHSNGTTSAGGTATSGNWFALPMTNQVYSRQTTSWANVTLGTNHTIVIQPGTYLIQGWHVFYDCDRCSTRLRNLTNSVELLNGISGFSNASTCMSRIYGAFPIGSAITIQFQYRVQTTKATTGLGIPTNFTGDTNVYGFLSIQKLI